MSQQNDNTPQRPERSTKARSGLISVRFTLSETFANFALNTLRMRQETVAAILGNKSTKFLKHYARITEESIAAEYKF